MTKHLVALVAAATLGGCVGPGYADRGTSAYDDHHVVYEEVVVRDADLIPARSNVVVRDSMSESERRKWIDEHNAPPRVVETTQRDPDVARVRYVPRYERERVIVVDREPRYVSWPLQFGLYYGGGRWHGSRRHHRDWSWGLGWGSSWCW